MPDESPEERLAATLLTAVAHLRAGRLEEALPGLAEVATELADQAELNDVRLRALCLLADALLRTDRVAEAGAAVDDARRVAGSMGGEARDAVAALAARLADAREAEATKARAAREAAALRGWSVDQLRERYGRDARQLAEVLVKKANAEVDVGSPSGPVVADEALAIARASRDVRAEVLAWVSVARASPSRAAEALEAAWRRAERADEFTLVALVARAAELQGVVLPSLVGPQIGSSATGSARDDGAPDDAMS